MNTPTKQEDLEKEIKERETLGIGEQKEGGRWNYTDTLKAELKGIKEGKAQAISEFKEKLKERIEKDFPFSANKMSKIIEKTAQEIK